MNTLIIFPPSAGCEVAHWLLEKLEIEFRLKPNSVPFFAIAIKLAGGTDYPFFHYKQQKISGSKDLVNLLEQELSPPHDCLPHSAEDIKKAKELWNTTVQPKLAFAVSRWAYRFLLPEKKLTYPALTKNVPCWQKPVVWVGYRLFAKLIGKTLAFNDNPAEKMEAMIREALDVVDQQLADGRPYFFGDKPCYLDIAFAGLAGPVILDPRYGGGGILPSIDEAPNEMLPLINETLQRPSGKLIQRMYAKHR